MIEAITRRRLLRRTVEGGMAVAATAGLISGIREALAVRHLDDDERRSDSSASSRYDAREFDELTVEDEWTKAHNRIVERFRVLKDVELPPDAVPVDWQYGDRHGYGSVKPRKRFHAGIDIAARYGQEVLAAADGKGSTYRDPFSGLTIDFYHFKPLYLVGLKFEIKTSYAHLSASYLPWYDFSLSPDDNFERGNYGKAERGDVIGLVGSDRSPQAHLHYQVEFQPWSPSPVDNFKYVNPSYLLVPSVLICTDKFLTVRPLSYPIACK